MFASVNVDALRNCKGMPKGQTLNFHVNVKCKVTRTKGASAVSFCLYFFQVESAGQHSICVISAGIFLPMVPTETRKKDESRKLRFISNVKYKSADTGFADFSYYKFLMTFARYSTIG